ncbi:MAG: sigma-70 family RNA polymerase sigma factor [Acidimicrobiales bacterium]
MRQRVQVREQAADAELAGLATTGDLAAFEELYRRHVEAAWRMALAVTSNPHDAADAVSDAFTRVYQALPDRPQAAEHFLPYLLAAVRNAAIDGLRRGGRQAASAGDHADVASLGAGPGDLLEADVEATLVARAFRSLPERWRSVLWLTEVEGIAARDVAMLLGMTPNGVAQLAVRARAGLRQRYLQAHLRQTEVRRSCRDTVSRLGAYAAGGLAPRDISKVDQHLAGCEACRSRLAQLQDVTPCLQRAVVPLPVALAALSAAKLHLATGGAAAGAGATAAAAPTAIGVGVAAAVVPVPLVATFASAALLVAGLVGAGVVADRSHRAVAPIAAAPASPPVAPTFVAASSPPAANPAQSADPVTGLVNGAVGSADLAGVSDLVARLGHDLARLPATAALAAAARSDVRIDVGPAAAADVDLREGSRPCPSFRVIGVQLGCHGEDGHVTVAPADPSAGAVAGGADAEAEAVPLADGLVPPEGDAPAAAAPPAP